MKRTRLSRSCCLVGILPFLNNCLFAATAVVTSIALSVFEIVGCSKFILYFFDTVSGAGESGKSTIFKQMQLLHNKGYTDEDRQNFKNTVHSNAIQNAKDLIRAAKRLEILTPDQLTPEIVSQTQFPSVSDRFKSIIAGGLLMTWDFGN